MPFMISKKPPKFMQDQEVFARNKETIKVVLNGLTNPCQKIPMLILNQIIKELRNYIRLNKNNNILTLNQLKRQMKKPDNFSKMDNLKKLMKTILMPLKEILNYPNTFATEVFALLNSWNG